MSDTPADGRLSPEHFDHHRAPEFQEKLRLAQKQEAARQALCRGDTTPETLAYARFLNAVENDATLRHGGFKKFRHDDEEVEKEWPFLRPVIRKETPNDR